MNIAMIFWRKIPHETEEVGEISQSPEKSHGNLDQTQRRLPRGPLRDGESHPMSKLEVAG